MPTSCPFVDIGDGSLLKVIQVKEREGLWIVENIFQAGFEVQKHRHTGPVWGYTTSGAWKYKEYDYVNRAGCFLYEPAGSIHTLQCIEDDTRVWFHMYGVNLNLDAERQRRERRRRCGLARVLPRDVRADGLAPAERAGRLSGERSTSTTPTTTSPRPPHEVLAELRRTQPVYFQDMASEPGYWMVLKHADVVHVAREPNAVLGERGRRDAREPRGRRSSR